MPCATSEKRPPSRVRYVRLAIHPLKLTVRQFAPENRPSQKRKLTSIATIHFQVLSLLVSGRVVLGWRPLASLLPGGGGTGCQAQPQSISDPGKMVGVSDPCDETNKNCQVICSKARDTYYKLHMGMFLKTSGHDLKHHLKQTKSSILGIFAAQALETPNKINKHFPVAKSVQKSGVCKKASSTFPRVKNDPGDWSWAIGGVVESCEQTKNTQTPKIKLLEGWMRMRRFLTFPWMLRTGLLPGLVLVVWCSRFVCFSLGNYQRHCSGHGEVGEPHHGSFSGNLQVGCHGDWTLGFGLIGY